MTVLNLNRYLPPDVSAGAVTRVHFYEFGVEHCPSRVMFRKDIEDVYADKQVVQIGTQQFRLVAITEPYMVVGDDMVHVNVHLGETGIARVQPYPPKWDTKIRVAPGGHSDTFRQSEIDAEHRRTLDVQGGEQGKASVEHLEVQTFGPSYGDHTRRSGRERRKVDRDIQPALYNELILAVGKKYPNETRHQTALRYIQEAERPSASDMEGKEDKK